MDMEATFPGGKKVAVHYRGLSVVTDQPRQVGGDDTALSPTELFLASIVACAGYFVLAFCTQRNISLEGIKVTQSMEVDPRTHLVSRLIIDIRLPEGFPEHYRPAVIRAVDQCTVKRHLQNPPAIEVRTV
ncbi:MAG: OsmC family protein [Chloroflexota bacterium]